MNRGRDKPASTGFLPFQPRDDGATTTDEIRAAGFPHTGGHGIIEPRCSIPGGRFRAQGFPTVARFAPIVYFVWMNVHSPWNQAVEAGKTRILHIGKYYPPVRGGMESFLECLATGLARSGTLNTVLVHDFKPKPLRRAAFDISEDKSKNPVVFRVPILGKWMHTPISPVFPFWLKKICRKFRPDIVHVQMPNISGFWAVAVACTRRRPLVLHWQADVDDPGNDHGLRLFYWLYRPFEQFLLRHASCVIVSSQAYLEGSRTLRRWRDKCSVVPLGIDPHAIPAPSSEDRDRARLLWGNSNCRVLSVGRLTFYKGMDQLVLAARNLPDARIVIVGTGREQSRIERLIDMHQLHERVLLAGECSDGLRSALLETCTCFCLPSIGRAESFGVASLEAMAFSKPVIVGNVPRSGVGWVVDHNVTGIHVEVASPEAIANAVNALASDPERATSMGEAGRHRLMDLFTIQAVVRQVMAVYTQLTPTMTPVQ